MPKIIFTDTTGMVPKDYYPTPAKVWIPEWMKNLAPYTGKKFKLYGDEGGLETNQTAKRCVPILDAAMMGYTILLPHDLNIEQTPDGPYYKWPSGAGIQWHPIVQASTHSVAKRGHDIPKLINPWSIQTPRGYSVMFLPPINEDKKILEPISGVVDTDEYINPVNFPFILKQGFEGTIPAGTPFVQVVPFKRESWVMSVVPRNTEAIERNKASISTVFRNAYRKMYWSRKDFS